MGLKAWAYILAWVLPEDSETKIEEQAMYLGDDPRKHH